MKLHLYRISWSEPPNEKRYGHNESTNVAAPDVVSALEHVRPRVEEQKGKIWSIVHIGHVDEIVSCD